MRASATHHRGVTLARDLPGIRVIRPLGRDAHRETWLVRLEGESPGPAVLVRPCDAAGRRMVRIEAAALHRGRGVGVVELVDVVGDPEGVALLREHCIGPRLAAVLAEREHWQAGEVVAALQPVVAALARLHRSGVAHGVVDAGEIILRSSGGVLVDLGRAELFEPGSPEAVLARVDAIARDRDAARALASDLLRRVKGSRSHAAHALADAVEQAPAFRLLGELCDGLDDLAAPLALTSCDVMLAELLADDYGSSYYCNGRTYSGGSYDRRSAHGRYAARALRRGDGRSRAQARRNGALDLCPTFAGGA